MPETRLLALPDLDVGRDEVGRAVREVLSRAAYDDLRRQGLRDAIDDLRRRLAEWLAQVLGQEGTAVLGWVLLAVAVLVVVLLAVRAARRLAGDPAAADDPLTAPLRTPETWLADADRHAAAGDVREAVRAGFRAVVAGLAAAGVVEEIPGTTVGEYRAQVRANAPSLQASFGAAADVFEEVWYAHREPSDAGLRTVLAAARRALPAGVG